MKFVFTLIALAGTCVAAFAEDGLAARTADHDYDPPSPGSYALPIIKPAADGPLLDWSNRPVQLRDLTRGRITVMSFIYTRCAANRACPYATGVLLELHELSAKDPALAKGMRLVSLSFDPTHDTPDRMAAYSSLVAQHPTGAPWHFVTTRSQQELQPILDAYGQVVDRKQNPLDPTGPLSHTLRVYLVDRDGNIRNIYGSDTLDVRLVAADVRTLLMESSSAKPSVSAPSDDGKNSKQHDLRDGQK